MVLALESVLLVSAMIGRVPSSFLGRSGPLDSISMSGKGKKKGKYKRGTGDA